MNFFRKKISGVRLVMVLITGLIYLGTTMCDTKTDTVKGNGIVHPNGKEFAGSESCFTCHQDISESHRKTAHYLTSQPADTSTIKGSFNPGSNTLLLNERLSISMQNTLLGLFQVGYVDDKEVIRAPIDITIGSGRQGQSYLSWQANKLFQLPASYSSQLNEWCNSPGYPTNKLFFNRPISGRCLECHGSYFKDITSDSTEPAYDRKQIMYGVDCERCHGPAADHVTFQTKHPEEKTGKFIINPAALSRQQKLDNCALCHSGLRENSKPSFSFVTGDKLDDYSEVDYKVDSSAELDVHGNQYGLLTASKCFRVSKTMDCSSCHNVHKSEAADVKVLSQRCMNCHSEEKHNFCKQKPATGLVLEDNCIDCHMPALASKKIFIESEKKISAPYLVRTHFISIYQDQVKQYLAKIKHGEITPKTH